MAATCGVKRIDEVERLLTALSRAMKPRGVCISCAVTSLFLFTNANSAAGAAGAVVKMEVESCILPTLQFTSVHCSSAPAKQALDTVPGLFVPNEAPLTVTAPLPGEVNLLYLSKSPPLKIRAFPGEMARTVV